jgi:hypothetical protein
LASVELEGLKVALFNPPVDCFFLRITNL